MADELSKNDRSETEIAFLRLRGIAKEVFRSLGGGEAFIRRERENFYGDNTQRRNPCPPARTPKS
jgi:hypothetical protein